MALPLLPPLLLLPLPLHHVYPLVVGMLTTFAAGAALVTDDALHGRQVSEAPLLEPIFHIDQLLGEFVEIPILFRSTKRQMRLEETDCQEERRLGTSEFVHVVDRLGSDLIIGVL